MQSIAPASIGQKPHRFGDKYRFRVGYSSQAPRLCRTVLHESQLISKITSVIRAFWPRRPQGPVHRPSVAWCA